MSYDQEPIKFDFNEYVDKLNVVFNFLFKDVPDTYDDTINTKLLDSIKSLITTTTTINKSDNNDGNSEKLIKFLNDFLNKQFNYEQLLEKDVEIQQFFYKLIIILYEMNCLTNEFKQKTVNYFTKTYLNTKKQQCIYKLDAIVRHSLLCIIYNLLISNSSSKTDANLCVLVQQLCVDRRLLNDQTIFIHKLVINILSYLLLYNVKCCKNNNDDLNLYIKELIENSNSNHVIVIEIYKNLYDNCVKFNVSSEEMKKIDEKLTSTMANIDMNKIILDLSNNCVDSYTYIWYKYMKLSSKFDCNSSLNDFCEHYLTSNANKKDFNNIYRFLYYLYELVDNETVKLQIIKQHMNGFKLFEIDENNEPFDYLKKIFKTSKQREFLIRDCLFNLNLFICKYKSKNGFKLQLNTNTIASILNHMQLNEKVKGYMIKLLVNYVDLIDYNEKIMIFMGIYEYTTKFCVLNDDLMKIFEYYLTKIHENEENDGIIYGQLFELLFNMIKFTKNEKNLEQLYKNTDLIVQFLTKLNNETFLIEFIKHENSYFIYDICYKQLFEEDTSDLNGEKQNLKTEITYLRASILKLISRFAKMNKLYQDFNYNKLKHLCVHESEAIVRRSAIDLLNDINEIYIEKNSEKADFVDNIDFDIYSNILHNDFDWQVQLNCLKYIQNFINFNEKISYSNEKLILKYLKSSLLTSILNATDDYDKNVQNLALNLLIKLIKNERFMCLFKNNLHLNNKYKQIIDIDIDDLYRKLNETTITFDLYTLNPCSLLDDIISNYEFNMNDNKITDCY